MRNHRARVALIAAGVTACTLLPVGTASAHGVCGVSTSTPGYDGNVSSDNWTWIATITCTVDHSDYYLRTCLQSSPEPLGVVGWTTHNCSEREWPGPDTGPHSLPAKSSATCVPGFWYRSWALGSAGNGGSHWGIEAQSAPAIACVPGVVTR